MKTSEQTNEISAALAKAQGAMRNPEKNRTARIPTKSGTTYEYSYADLPSVFDSARKPLTENSLGHSASIDYSEQVPYLKMRLTHCSGQFYESSYRLPTGCDDKQLASSITYGRRYLFCALIGIAAEDDTDSAPEPSATYQEKAKKEQKPSPVKPLPNPEELEAQARLKSLNDAIIQSKWPAPKVAELMQSKFKTIRCGQLSTEQFQSLITVILGSTPEQALSQAQ